MTGADIPELIGILVSCYGIGWGMGFMFATVKKGLEKLL